MCGETLARQARPLGSGCRTCHALCRDSRPPRALRNNAACPDRGRPAPGGRAPGRPPAPRPRRTPTGTRRSLPPLPSQQHRPSSSVDVVHVETDGLRDAGPVPYSNSSRARSRSAAVRPRLTPAADEQRDHVVERQGLRQPSPARRLRVRDVGRAMPSAAAKRCSPRTARAARGRRTAASGGMRRVALAQRHQEVADVGLGDSASRAPAAPRSSGSGEVAPVGRQRVARRRRARPRDGRGSCRLHGRAPTARRPCVRPTRSDRPGQGASGPRNSDRPGPRAASARMPATAVALTISPASVARTASSTVMRTNSMSASSCSGASGGRHR